MPEKKTILVVDDEEEIRELFLSLAEHDFFEFPVEVFTAEDPEEAERIILARPGKVVLVIADIDLPPFSGWEIIEFVLRLAVAPKLMAMTGNDNCLLGLKERGVLCLQKPFTIQMVQKMINDLLRDEQ